MKAPFSRDDLETASPGEGLPGCTADLRVLRLGGRRVAVKDLGRRNRAWRSLVGRVLLAREARLLARLRGVEGVPALLGRVDPDAIALEHVEGVPLALHAPGRTVPPGFPASLAAVVRAMHDRGVAHGDLSNRRNILVTPGGRAFLVDFGLAVSRGSPLFEVFRGLDLRAVAKCAAWHAVAGRFPGPPRPLAHRLARRLKLLNLPHRVAKARRKALPGYKADVLRGLPSRV
ncbi:MAG: hypothetical protein HY722_16630 [Planctomycetes bacterium]|nr:hypothetical protein [Planctomycetota bacterium]